MHKLTSRQETILSETRKIFGNHNNDDFTQKISLFLDDVFPKIEELNRNFPDEFEKITNDIYTIILTQDIKWHTFYLKNQDYVGLNNHRNSYTSVFRTKVIILEESGNLRLSNFIIDYGYLIDNWLHGENGSRAILKEVNKDDGYCYVATMVYGDYNHPNVIQLRNYRDNKLNKYELGRAFISYYYRYSPYWVKRMKNCSLINKLLKISIDLIVSKIK